MTDVVTTIVRAVFSRLLRRTGKLHHDVTAWTGGVYGAGDHEERNFTLFLLNEKEVGVTLRNFRVEFYKDGSRIHFVRPMLAQNYTPQNLIYLPPHKPVDQGYKLSFGPSDEALAMARSADEIKLVGEFTGKGIIFRRMLVENLPLWGGPEPPSYLC